MRDTLNFIKVFTNPKDIYAFMSIIDRPKRGLGTVALKKLQDKAIEHTMSIIEYLLSEHINDLTPGMRKKVQSLVDVYQTLIDPANQHMQLTEMVPFLLKSTGYVEWVQGLKNNVSHLRNLEILKGMVKDFQDEYSQTHHNFTLFDIANAFTFEMTSSIREEDHEGVTVATIHGAKGLEWSHVFVLGMEQENFPGNRIVDNDDMESERRLMYVAVTRAKNSLWLCESTHRITYGDNELTPSQFLQEIGDVPESNI
jgi:DNA helicase-2/ATP-dependent DNA helicase PcrA